MENINQKAICELSDLLHQNNLKEIEYEAENVRIRVVACADSTPIAPVLVPSCSSQQSKTQEKEPQINEDNYIKSPMVGIVYLAPDPSTPPFVHEGDMVGVGQTLCLVEAMKTFNSVKATKSGKIQKILVQSGSPVEFGEPLFIIE